MRSTSGRRLCLQCAAWRDLSGHVARGWSLTGTPSFSARQGRARQGRDSAEPRWGRVVRRRSRCPCLRTPSTRFRASRDEGGNGGRHARVRAAAMRPSWSGTNHGMAEIQQSPGGAELSDGGADVRDADPLHEVPGFAWPSEGGDGGRHAMRAATRSLDARARDDEVIPSTHSV